MSVLVLQREEGLKSSESLFKVRGNVMKCKKNERISVVSSLGNGSSCKVGEIFAK